MVKWETRRLEDVAEFYLGKMLDRRKNKGELRPYLANLNVRWGEFELDNLRQMRFQEHETDRYGLRHGDIVMCEGGEPGRCAIWKNQQPEIMFQKALHRIRPSELLDYRFLYYSFLNRGKVGGFDQYCTGATIKHLPRQNLALVEVELPPINAQRRIASILTAYDDLIENNTRRIEIIEEMARRLYEEWFVHFRFPGHEQVSFKETELGRIPEGWDSKVLGDIVEEVRDSIHPSKVEEETPYVGLEHIPRRSITLPEWGRASDVDSTKLRFSRGDTLFGKIRPYFHKVVVAPLEGICSSEVV